MMVIKGIKIEDRYWLCPHCNKQTKSNNGAEWCGKNLQCGYCGTYSYYKDYKQ